MVWKYFQQMKKSSKNEGNLSRIWMNARKSNKQERKDVKKRTNKKGIKAKMQIAVFFLKRNPCVCHVKFPTALRGSHTPQRMCAQRRWSSSPNRGCRTFPVPPKEEIRLSLKQLQKISCWERKTQTDRFHFYTFITIFESSDLKSTISRTLKNIPLKVTVWAD